MSRQIEVRVPDIGDFDDVSVIEVLVSAGDAVAVDQGLITLESDKASMEVPSTAAGTIVSMAVKVGDSIAEGTVIAIVETADAGTAESADAAPPRAGSDAPAKAEPVVAEVTAAASKPAKAPKTDDEGPFDHQAEVLVLGSGPGGYTAAFRAADLGKKVVLVERYPVLGGVCLNVGCIPSKALLHAAEVIEEAAAFAEHGIAFGAPKIDREALRAFKDGVVGKLVGGLGGMAKRRKVTVVEGRGRFASGHRLQVETAAGKTEVVAFEQAIIAVGSRPVELPFLPDDPRIMDSTAALELPEAERLLVIGGGIIGLEMATVYHALGSEVTVVEMLDQLIPGCDADMVRPLHRRLESRYAGIRLETRVSEIKAKKKELSARFEGKEPGEARFDRALVSVGRRPNGERIDAAAAGVEVDARGFIPVDRQMRTSAPHIFAIGDVVGNPMLAHKATHEGKVAAEVAAGEASHFDARVIPSVAYTDPEVAWVGLTENEAKAQGVDYETGSFPWVASGRALAIGRDEGKTKLLFDPKTRRLLGAAMVGPRAGDLVSEAALAIEMGCDAEDLALTIHPHPTLSETVAFSAEAFVGTLTDLYPPKRK